MLQMNEYQERAMSTLNPGVYVDSKLMLLNGILGMNGEAGEVADILKKHLFQGHELDAEKIMNEAGDVLWYIALVAESLGYTLEQFAEFNLAKLRARYPKGFNVDGSVNRSNAT